MPNMVVECGFNDSNLANPGPSLEELSKSNATRASGMERSRLFHRLFRHEPAIKMGKKAWLQCQIHPNKKAKNLPNLLTGDEDLTFSKSLFSRLHVDVQWKPDC